MTAFMSVVLPAPLRPMRPIIDCSGTASDTPRRICTALIATLRDRSWQVRERAALALGAVGQNQPGAIPALEEAMRDEHRFVRSSAATALALLAPHAKSARVALEQARYDPDAGVRYSAGLALNQVDSETGASAALK